LKEQSDKDLIADWASLAHAEDGASAEQIRAVIEEEVQGNLNYILHRTSEEREFHNGTRDKGRAFGQFCERHASAKDRATMLEEPSFCCDDAHELHVKYRPQWDALDGAKQREYAVRFEHFVQHPNARTANLSEAHVLALRLYTTHAFKYVNSPLRNVQEYGHGRRPHPLPVIVSYIAEGIKKLRTVYVSDMRTTRARRLSVKDNKGNAVMTTNLWRGMKGLQAKDEFMHLNGGGTEMAPMSTTTDIKVAAQYGMSGSSLLFKLRVDSFIQYGVRANTRTLLPQGQLRLTRFRIPTQDRLTCSGCRRSPLRPKYSTLRWCTFSPLGARKRSKLARTVSTLSKSSHTCLDWRDPAYKVGAQLMCPVC
jgi:hypothetical protein